MHLLFIQKMEQQLPSSSIIYFFSPSDQISKRGPFCSWIACLLYFHFTHGKRHIFFSGKRNPKSQLVIDERKQVSSIFRGVQLAFLCGDTMMQVTSLPVACSPPSPTTSKHQIKCPEAVPETVSSILV